MANEENDIAIVGIGLKFPGNANCVESFWRNLSEGVDSVSEIPEDRWNIDTHYFPGDAKKLAKSKSKWGGFIDDVVGFDASFFGVSALEAETLDPQQRLLLETSWNAVEDSGLNAEKLKGAKAGVYVGGFTLDYMVLQLGGNDFKHLTPYSASGCMMTLLSNRLSHFLGLHGPSLSVDTACSSSLVAIHLACRSIINGESDFALAGGVNVMVTPGYFVAESHAGMLSPTGKCRSFDSQSDGYVRAEGAGVVVLKKLSDAIEDKDRIYAVIKGSGINHDGNNENLTVPSGSAQRLLMEGIYNDIGIFPGDVTFVEAHGTGTPVGDPIEANTIGNLMKEGRDPSKPCYIGSVKTNMGHAEAAAGVAGLIKASLCLYKRALPPHLHFNEANKNINLAELKLKVPTQLETLDQSAEQLIAGVNSFGFGGSNAHVVLGAYPNETLAETDEKRKPSFESSILFPLSAKSKESLNRYAALLSDDLKEIDDAEFTHFCDVICNRRDHFDIRAAIVADNRMSLVKRLKSFAEEEYSEGIIPKNHDEITSTNKKNNKAVWVYTGNGPQWWGMGQGLYYREKVFKNKIEEICNLFDELNPKWSLRDEIFKSEENSRVNETQISQPFNFAIQVALSSLLKSWGLKPDAVVGHSGGEPAAAYIAGALTLHDAALVIYHRSRLQQQTAGEGRLIAVEGDNNKLIQLIESIGDEKLSIAAINSSSSLTVSGSEESIEVLDSKLKTLNFYTKLLQVDIPYHSHAMEDIKEELISSLSGVKSKSADIAFYSTVTGALVTDEMLDANYWYENIRNPVQFYSVINQLVNDGYNGFIEIGPHPVLSANITQVLREAGKEGFSLHTLNRKQSEHDSVLGTLGELYCKGYSVDWGTLIPEYDYQQFLSYPQYPWNHKEEYWAEPVLTKTERVKRDKHPILARKLKVQQPTWEVDLLEAGFEFMQDHKIKGVVVFPGSAYLEMYIAATKLIYGEQASFEINNVTFHKATFFHKATYFTPDAPANIQLAFDKSSSRFSISSEEKYGWEMKSTSEVIVKNISTPESRDIDLIKSRLTLTKSKKECYESFKSLGLEYGENFQGINSINYCDGAVLAELELNNIVNESKDSYSLHPILGDLCLQTMAATVPEREGSSKTVYMPTSLGKVKLFSDPYKGMYVYTRVIKQDDFGLICDIELLGANGEVLLSIEDSYAKAIGNEKKVIETRPQDVYTLDWREHVLEAASENEEHKRKCWVIFGDGDDLEEEILKQLDIKNQQCITVKESGEFGSNNESFTIVPDSKDDYLQLFNEIKKQNPVNIAGIIYLWSAQVISENANQNFAYSKDSTNRMNIAPLYLMQTLSAQDWGGEKPKVWFVTQNAQPVADKRKDINFLQSSLWGFARVAGQVEHQDIWGGIIDIGGIDDIPPVSIELFNKSEEDQVAFRNSVRYVPRLIRSDESRLYTPLRLRSDISYLITGGLGALGLATASSLVESGASHIILIGRNGLPDRSAWEDLDPSDSVYNKVQAIKDLERNGASVVVASVNISSFDELKSFVEAYERDSHPLIGGVFHTAGVAIPERIIDMGVDNFEKVLPAKIDGTLNLHQCFKTRELDHFVLYSSLASVVTSMGQASYSAANAFLDSFAHWRKANGYGAISINWGPWGEVGMAADLNLVDFFKSRGFYAMTTEQGTSALRSLMGVSTPQAVLVGADWHVVANTGYPSGNGPSYMNDLLLERVDSNTDQDDNALGQDTDFLMKYIDQENDSNRKEMIAQHLINMMCRLIKEDPAGITNEQSFISIGLDSMVAIDLRINIERTMGVSVETVDLLKGDSIAEFSAFCFDEIQKNISEITDDIEGEN